MTFPFFCYYMTRKNAHTRTYIQPCSPRYAQTLREVSTRELHARTVRTHRHAQMHKEGHAHTRLSARISTRRVVHVHTQAQIASRHIPFCILTAAFPYLYYALLSLFRGSYSLMQYSKFTYELALDDTVALVTAHYIKTVGLYKSIRT